MRGACGGPSLESPRLPQIGGLSVSGWELCACAGIVSDVRRAPGLPAPAPAAAAQAALAAEAAGCRCSAVAAAASAPAGATLQQLLLLLLGCHLSFPQAPGCRLHPRCSQPGPPHLRRLLLSTFSLAPGGHGQQLFPRELKQLLLDPPPHSHSWHWEATWTCRFQLRRRLQGVRAMRSSLPPWAPGTHWPTAGAGGLAAALEARCHCSGSLHGLTLLRYAAM
mmetsp:Transcript_11308/g.30840  ORF Transcript_11308/g.30840 Transcript_11308/m.30840 type:complete len:222 (-) Transcript_11308:1917-2582(-)